MVFFYVKDYDACPTVYLAINYTCHKGDFIPSVLPRREFLQCLGENILGEALAVSGDAPRLFVQLLV